MKTPHQMPLDLRDRDEAADQARPSGPCAQVRSLTLERARREVRMMRALDDRIIASIQHIDVVGLLTLAAEREMKAQALQT
ncbi:hypothetical protein [Roseateles sp. L2-2]|uniref:hypothetical protein n=1 Tax=Roseateles sp. L2-2 TaxID=3422597 RepID=UPI003D36DF60